MSSILSNSFGFFFVFSVFSFFFTNNNKRDNNNSFQANDKDFIESRKPCSELYYDKHYLINHEKEIDFPGFKNIKNDDNQCQDENHKNIKKSHLIKNQNENNMNELLILSEPFFFNKEFKNIALSSMISLIMYFILSGLHLFINDDEITNIVISTNNLTLFLIKYCALTSFKCNKLETIGLSEAETNIMSINKQIHNAD